MTRMWMALSALLFVCVQIQAGDSDALGKDPRVYHIGNSLVRNLPVERLQKLFESAGGSYDYGIQLAGGHKLYMHLDKRNWTGKSGTGRFNTRKPYGTYETALRKHTWDALVLQPYKFKLDQEPTYIKRWPFFTMGSKQVCSAFIDYALGKTEKGSRRYDLENPNTGHVATRRFYVYATWPGTGEVLNQDGEKTFANYWQQPYNGGEEHKREFFYKLVDGLNKLHPDLQTPVRMIPVGDVFAALDKKIREDKLPGIAEFYARNQKYYIKARRNSKKKPPFDPDQFDRSAGVLNFYADGVHMNDQPHNGRDSGTIGAYVASLTFYATLSGESPVGLTAKPYELFDADKDSELIKALQQTVWDVVAGHPHTGIAKR